jgi:hypothetical protein
MTGPEHYIAAEELLEDVGHARDEDDAARVLGIAQVHATLALAAATAVGTRDIDNQAWVVAAMMRVVGPAGPGAARAGAVAAQHLRGGPAVQFHQVPFGAAPVQPGMAEMVPEPLRPGIHAALPAAAGDHLVDPVRSHRPAVVHPEPQLRPPRLRMPGPDPDIAVQGTGGLVPDPDDPRPAALAATVISRPCRSRSLHLRSCGS